ncbi:MAG: SDR family NAD(P)-dependent oxidoreductase [Simplicispira suum]|uniref:SDR family NAD(P)-dependent oxidoreductase n=1 Tax=Simplicispira suum TaxID=2109915 RepID=UPI001C6AB3D8|nr:SDR family NAD(P)-dependent oxidoreductase [Simplicispira suum]MBW7833963.1 SDR family NAD(P)-dependent oxidoreductase [Simplicispira suum]
MPSYLITGASSGLGLQVAMRLARPGAHRLVLPVRSATRARELVQALDAPPGTTVLTPLVDLSSLQSVAGLLHDPAVTGGPLFDGVLFNAGVQAAGTLDRTVDGHESSFAVNHLAHHLLLRGLLAGSAPRLAADAIVGWTASGTHDPAETSARLSGFRGAQYASAAQVARGDYGTTAAQACRDAYATSKLCNIVSAQAMAQALAKGDVNGPHFFSFDPGLMPGTGLARRHPAAAQWVWRHVLPRLAALLPGTSTPAKSAAILADLLTGRLRSPDNGAYFNYTGRQVPPAAPALESWVARDLMTTSDAMTARFASAA